MIATRIQTFRASDGYTFYVRHYPAVGRPRAKLVFLHGIRSHGGWYTRSCAEFAAAGFDVYRSNQVPNTSSAKYKIIAGHRSAWSRAQQILETEAYRPERRFADALKGLHVYGAKVVRPYNLACLVASDT